MKMGPTIMQDSSEIVHYDMFGIPLYVRKRNLSEYPKHRYLCHWHEDIEFIRVYSGYMFYKVNNTNILLKAGDCLFVNARQSHFGYNAQKHECDFLCILVKASLLFTNEILYQKYFQPFLEIPYIHISKNDNNLQTLAQELLDAIWENKENGIFGYELLATAYLNRLWLAILETKQFNVPKERSLDELVLYKDMVQYIHNHFNETLSLDKIAAAGKVCRSRCCALFKKYAHESPIQFLNHYRLEVSCDLLISTNLSITDIAIACGFNSPSYYDKLFARHYHNTPQQYRNKL